RKRGSNAARSPSASRSMRRSRSRSDSVTSRAWRGGNRASRGSSRGSLEHSSPRASRGKPASLRPRAARRRESPWIPGASGRGGRSAWWVVSPCLVLATTRASVTSGPALLRRHPLLVPVPPHAQQDLPESADAYPVRPQRVDERLVHRVLHRQLERQPRPSELVPEHHVDRLVGR